jgi:hypothetical protein
MVPNGGSLTKLRLRGGVAAAVLITTLLAGCGTEQPSSVVPEVSLPPVTAARDGLLVTLAVERASLPAAARTWVSVSVINTSNEVRMWQGGGCNFLADIRIETATAVTPELGRVWKGLPGRFKQLVGPPTQASNRGSFIDERFVDQSGVACPADLRVNVISAGQRLQMKAAWDGEIEGVVAPSGPARIVASFPYLGPAGKPDAPQPIEATMGVDVIDQGVRLLSPGEAIDAALGNRDFADFLAAAGMPDWSGVDIESHGHAYVVVLSLATIEGRATVDRQTGAVTFARRARQ